MPDNAGITRGNVTFGRGVTGPGGWMFCSTEGCSQVHDMYAIKSNCEGYTACPECGTVLKQLCRHCGLLWISPTEFVRWTKEMSDESTRRYNDPDDPASYKYRGAGRYPEGRLHEEVLAQFGAQRFRIVAEDS